MVRVTRRLLAVCALITLALSLVALSQSPFAAPYKARTQAEIQVALDDALDQSLTPMALEDRIQAALNEGEADRAAALLRLGMARGLEVSPETINAVTAAEAATEGWRGCVVCAFDPTACADLTQVATCNLPAEMTPLGDINAVRRALTAWTNGEEVDRIDLSLGLVGLTATAGVLVTGGSTASIKAGATGLRVARRTGSLTRPMGEAVGNLARRSVDWDGVGDVVRGRRAASALTTVAADVSRLRASTSTADALAILRYTDSPEELARMARVAEVAGPETRGALDFLGKARLLRVAERLTELYLATVALLTALAAQLAALALWTVRRWLRTLDRRQGERFS